MLSHYQITFLVGVLAAVAGFTGAIHNNLLIAVAGTIVGLSGTISMAVGAYLSSKSFNQH